MASSIFEARSDRLSTAIRAQRLEQSCMAPKSQIDEADTIAPRCHLMRSAAVNLGVEVVLNL